MSILGRGRLLALVQRLVQSAKMSIRPGLTVTTVIGFIAVLAASVTIFGKPLARKHASVLNVLSFQEGPFSWSYSFSVGTVGPFRIGDSRQKAIQSATDCKCFWAYSLAPNEGRIPLNDVPNGSMTMYFPQDGYALLSAYKSSAPQYHLLFAQGRLKHVTVSKFIFAGL